MHQTIMGFMKNPEHTFAYVYNNVL